MLFVLDGGLDYTKRTYEAGHDGVSLLRVSRIAVAYVSMIGSAVRG